MVTRKRPGILQVYWRTFQRVLELQEVRRWDEEESVYRVAWRNIRKWRKASFCWGMGGRNNKTPVLPTRTGACSEDLTVQCEGQPQRAKESIKDTKKIFNPICKVPNEYRIQVGELGSNEEIGNNGAFFDSL